MKREKERDAGRERIGSKKGREKKEERERSPVLAAVLIQLVGCPGAWGVGLCEAPFEASPPWREVSHCLCTSVLIHSRFFQTFLEMGWRLWGLAWSCSPLQSLALLSLIPAPALSRAVLFCRSHKQEVCPRKAALPPYSPFSSHIVVFLMSVFTNSPWLLFPKILGWLLTIQLLVFEMCTLAPDPLGFCSGQCLRSTTTCATQQNFPGLWGTLVQGSPCVFCCRG